MQQTVINKSRHALTNWLKVQQRASAPSRRAALAGKTAEWIVEDYSKGGSLAPFDDFGTVKFSNCKAQTPNGGTDNLQGAAIADIRQNGQVLTSSEILSPTELEVSHI